MRVSAVVIIIYRDGPYAGQDDYLVPPPHRLPAWGGEGHYQRTRKRDATGRIIYEWVAAPANEESGVLLVSSAR